MRAEADHLGSRRFPTLTVAGLKALCAISTAAQPGQFVDNNRFLIGLAGTASLGRARHQALPALLAQSSRAETFEAVRARTALFLRRVSPPLICT